MFRLSFGLRQVTGDGGVKISQKLQSPVKIRSETELIKPSKTCLVKRKMGSLHDKSSWVSLLHLGASETVTSEPGRTGWAI